MPGLASTLRKTAVVEGFWADDLHKDTCDDGGKYKLICQVIRWGEVLRDLTPDNVLYAAAICAESGVFGLLSCAVFLLPSPSSQPSQTVFSDDPVSRQKHSFFTHPKHLTRTSLSSLLAPLLDSML